MCRIICILGRICDKIFSTAVDGKIGTEAVYAGVKRCSSYLQSNRKLVDLKPVEALLGEGSGIQANLYQALRKAGVPIHAFRKADQVPVEKVTPPLRSRRRRAA